MRMEWAVEQQAYHVCKNNSLCLTLPCMFFCVNITLVSIHILQGCGGKNSFFCTHVHREWAKIVVRGKKNHLVLPHMAEHTLEGVKGIKYKFVKRKLSEENVWACKSSHSSHWDVCYTLKLFRMIFGDCWVKEIIENFKGWNWKFVKIQFGLVWIIFKFATILVIICK